MLVQVDICWLEACRAQAGDGPEVISAGRWSQPVADIRGRAVRGRLVLCEKPRSDDLRETPLYVELQDVSEALAGSMRLFCDMGKHDFNSAYRGGLQCEMHDNDGRPVDSTPVALGGVPQSLWVTLPMDATIRLRATPFGICREKALAICPHLGKPWVIGDNDRKEYFLSGTFTVDPADDRVEPGDEIWRGTIVLPAVRIVNQRE